MYETVARASTAPVPWVVLVVVIGYVAWVVVGDDDQPLFFLPLIFLIVVLALALDLRPRAVVEADQLEQVHPLRDILCSLYFYF